MEANEEPKRTLLPEPRKINRKERIAREAKERRARKRERKWGKKA